MRVVLALFLLTVAATSGQIVQNICQPTEVVFLLDHSENAKKASTLTESNKFELLKQAFDQFMTSLSSSGDSLFRIWAWAYSSTGEPVEVVPRNTLPSQARSNQIGVMPSGGSWTYRGMEKVSGSTPSMQNNIVIIISAQGSFASARRSLAKTQFDKLTANRWRTSVIGCKSSVEIDEEELQLVNGGRVPVILDDGRATNKKSYSLLGQQLQAIKNQILCPPQLITTQTVPTLPPFTLPPVTRRPFTGICSNCKVEAGIGFDRHPDYCDSFYQCKPDGSYVKRNCGQSLIWNSDISTCVRTSSAFTCPTGVCNANTPSGTVYPSGTCCNKFFRCENGVLMYRQCPAGQAFDGGRCQQVGNMKSFCAAKNSHICDVGAFTQCDNFKPDSFGNPCKFYNMDHLTLVPYGTAWNQADCSLMASKACLDQDVSLRGLQTLSNQCSAILLSTFDDGRPNVESQRTPTLELYVQLFNVVKTGGAAVYNPTGSATATSYYFFFANNHIVANSAFRIAFKMAANAQVGVEYDLLSNVYCSDCPETVSVTVRKTGSNGYILTSKFTDTATNSVIQTTTTVSGVSRSDWMDATLIWGESTVYGQVNILNGNKSFQRKVEIQAVSHSFQGSILANKCGLLLGSGPNSNFMGMIDMFAYYSTCNNINDVLALRA